MRETGFIVSDLIVIVDDLDRSSPESETVLGGDLDKCWQWRTFERRNRLWRAAGLRQPCQVGLHRLLVFESRQCLSHDLCSPGVGWYADAVMHPLAVSTS